MFRKFKQFIRHRRLQRFGVYPKVDVNKSTYGQNGGAWMICPDNLNDESVIYSFGVGRNISFDLDLIEKTGATVHAFDPTPRSIDWVKQQSTPPQFVFHDYGIADFDGELKFYPPRRERSSHYAPVKRYKDASLQEFVLGPVHRLSTIMEKLGHDRVDLLKIDIEGGEYDVIDNLVSGTVTIAQIMLEFHHDYSAIPIEKTLQAVSQLRDVGFEIFHISDRSYEISFLHKTQLDQIA
jgi:FkbM family methyltransferase